MIINFAICRRALRENLPSAAVSCLVLACVSSGAHADRVVLAPTGSTLTELSIKSELMISSTAGTDRSWFTYASSDGIELELNRLESPAERKKQWSANLEYPLPTLQNLPAISVGIRDMTGTGAEHGAFYLAASRNVPLSSLQHRFLRSAEISLGAGTGPIGGGYIGLSSRLRTGLQLSAEVFERRPNFSAGLPVMKGLQLKAYSLNGHLFYGASYHFAR